MAGMTECRNYPYPTDGDPIDVAGDIARLADAVDADVCAIAADSDALEVGIATVSNNLGAHINDPSGAHMASAIGFVPTATLPVGDVQEAIELAALQGGSGGGGGGGGVDIQVFVANGTWTKPEGAATVTAIVVGGGHGGGSGRRGSTTTQRYGGGGGSPGSMVVSTLDAAALAATEAVTIGVGGVGAAAITTDDTNGATGGQGGASIFGPMQSPVVPASGGTGGTAAAGAAGAAGLLHMEGSFALAGGGSGGQTTGSSPSFTTIYRHGGTGGGGGGGLPPSASSDNGGGTGGTFTGNQPTSVRTALVGGAPGSIANGGLGANGGNEVATRWRSTGGGGGVSGFAAAAGRGGDGGPGSGGGGGGGSSNGFASGAGGNGGDGFVVVVTHLDAAGGGSGGGGGGGLPAGGTTGQALTKTGDADFVVGWANASKGVRVTGYSTAAIVPTDIPGASVTYEAASGSLFDVIIGVHGQMTGTGPFGSVRVVVDGAVPTFAPNMNFPDAQTRAFSFAFPVVVSGAGTHTIKLQASVSDPPGGVQLSLSDVILNVRPVGLNV